MNDSLGLEIAGIESEQFRVVQLLKLLNNLILSDDLDNKLSIELSIKYRVLLDSANVFMCKLREHLYKANKLELEQNV